MFPYIFVGPVHFCLWLLLFLLSDIIISGSWMGSNMIPIYAWRWKLMHIPNQTRIPPEVAEYALPPDAHWTVDMSICIQSGKEACFCMRLSLFWIRAESFKLYAIREDNKNHITDINVQPTAQSICIDDPALILSNVLFLTEYCTVGMLLCFLWCSSLWLLCIVNVEISK